MLFTLTVSPPPFLFVLLVNCFYRTSNRALCLSHRGRKPKEEKKSSIPTQPHPAQPRDNSRNPLPPRLHWHHNSAAVTLLSCWTVWGGEVGAVQLDCQIHWPLQESSTDPPAPYYSERLFYWESHSVFFCSANRLNTQTEPLTAETCAATRVSVTRYSSCAVWTNACASNNTIYQNYFQYGATVCECLCINIGGGTWFAPYQSEMFPSFLSISTCKSLCIGAGM